MRCAAIAEITSLTKSANSPTETNSIRHSGAHTGELGVHSQFPVLLWRRATDLNAITDHTFVLGVR